MIIECPEGQGCEVHLKGTHDAIWVRHNGDRVEVREFVVTHNNEGDGVLVYEHALNPKTVACPPDVKRLNIFEAAMLMAKRGLKVEWDTKEDETNPPVAVAVFSGSVWYHANAKVDTEENRQRIFCEVMTRIADAFDEPRHTSRR